MVERYLVEVAAPRPLVLLKPVPTVAVGEFVQLVAVVEHQSSAVAEGVAPPTADAGGAGGDNGAKGAKAIVRDEVSRVSASGLESRMSPSLLVYR